MKTHDILGPILVELFSVGRYREHCCKVTCHSVKFNKLKCYEKSYKLWKSLLTTLFWWKKKLTRTRFVNAIINLRTWKRNTRNIFVLQICFNLSRWVSIISRKYARQTTIEWNRKIKLYNLISKIWGDSF